MHIALRLMTVGLAGLLGGCGGDATGDPARVGALASRVDALEKRLAAAERSAEPIEQLRNDVASLDRRMSSLETTVRELASRPAQVAPPTSAPQGAPGADRPMPSSGPAAWNNPTTRPDRTQRRTELRALSDEFRSRLSQLRGQPDGPEKTREILDWYREQRRAILRGEGRTDQ